MGRVLVLVASCSNKVNQDGTQDGQKRDTRKKAAIPDGASHEGQLGKRLLHFSDYNIFDLSKRYRPERMASSLRALALQASVLIPNSDSPPEARGLRGTALLAVGVLASNAFRVLKLTPYRRRR